MITKDFLRQIQDAVYAPYFHEEMCRQFQAAVEKGEFAKEQREYDQAVKTLSKQLSELKRQYLIQYEECCKLIREYSGAYGFKAGVYSGFKQKFTLDRAYDGGFDQYVVSDIGLMPNMKRHTANYSNIEKRNELHNKIIADEPKKVSKLMVVLECYWSQAAHSASLNGFYCGYRAAMDIAFQIAPFEGNYNEMTSKVLSMEHHLGYIKSYSEIERETERAQANPKNPESDSVNSAKEHKGDS